MTTSTSSSLLSDADRARIREEMLLREEIRRELSPPKPKATRSSVHHFMNSPFFLTVVCGLAASVIGQLYVHANARNERALAQENSLREKRTALITSVANDLPTFISIYGSMKMRHVWLLENKGETAKDMYGRSRDEVYATFIDFFKMYIQARKPESILADVRSFFESPDVISKAAKEQAAIDAIETAKTPDEVKIRAKDQDRAAEGLLKAMAAELRRPARE